jgi:hypothetical protein
MLKQIFLCGYLFGASIVCQAQLNLSIGHFWVDGPNQDYQITSISGKLKNASWAAKLTLPFIQKAPSNSNEVTQSGLGNGLLKVSKQWKWKKTALRMHGKQKFATSDEKVVAAVKDRSFSIELNRVVGYGIGFVELGHWWRENKEYKRNDTWYGAVGYLKPLKPYSMGFIVDHKPTALGEEDSVLSVILKRPLRNALSASILIGTGLNESSPNFMLGTQFTQKF